MTTTQAHKDAAAAFVAMLPEAAKPAASLFYRYALLIAKGEAHEAAMQGAKDEEAASICKLLSNDSYYKVDGKTMPQTAAEILSERVYNRLQATPETNEQRSHRAGYRADQMRHLATTSLRYSTAARPACPVLAALAAAQF